MNRKVMSINESVSLLEVVDVFFNTNFFELPVVDKDGDLIGRITTFDLISTLLPGYEDMLDELPKAEDLVSLEDSLFSVPKKFSLLDDYKKLSAKDILKEDIVTVKEDDSLLKAAALCFKFRLGRLPVVRERKLVGIISLIDISHAFLKQIREKMEIGG
jgi:predicted transcriptional regulator